jgi:thiamine-phosphate pyrophosphorylase
MLKLPRLYPILDRATLDARGVSVAAFAGELARAGVGMVQYRDKVSGPQEVLRAAGEISAAFAGRDCVLVMNDRADLALLAGWTAVHVGQGDLPVEAVRSVMGAGAAEAVGVGVSTHNLEQVTAADAAAADYVAVGPVFGTTTKLDAERVVGLEGVRRARKLTSRPLVAIGGITRENARSVIEAGADSVAVISRLFVPGMSVGEVVEDFLERLR